MAPIVYLVQDLLFSSKIRETARQIGLTVESARDSAALVAAARGAQLVILDLRRGDAMATLALLAEDPETRTVPSVGFIDHEQVDQMELARDRGCKRVLAKGKFSSELPALFAELSKTNTG